MSLLDRIDEVPEAPPQLVATPVPKGSAERAAMPMQQVLDTSKSTVLAELDAIIRLQLLFPFASLKELSAKAGRSRYYLATIMGTAAYKALYEKTKRDMDIAVGLPTLAEEIDTGARVAVAKLVETIENTDDGYLVKQGTEVLLKARGQGGFSPPPAPVTTVLVDARQASILEVRERAMAEARAAGPYPTAAAVPGHRPVLDVLDEPPVQPPTGALVDPLEAELAGLPGAQP